MDGQMLLRVENMVLAGIRVGIEEGDGVGKLHFEFGVALNIMDGEGVFEPLLGQKYDVLSFPGKYRAVLVVDFHVSIIEDAGDFYPALIGFHLNLLIL